MDMSLVLTHDCNLACPYCYTGAKFRRRMSRDTALRALDLAFSDASARMELSYFGGEPTLELDLLLELAAEASRRAGEAGIELVQSVTTNGTLLDSRKVQALQDLGLHIALSIDGNRAAHEVNRPTMGGASSFDAVERTLGLLCRSGYPFVTISVVTPKSAAHLGASVAYLFAAGVQDIVLNPCYEDSWSDEALALWEVGLEQAADCMTAAFRRGERQVIQTFENKILAGIKGGLAPEDRCKVGVGFVAVSPQGHLYACERLVGEDNDVQARIGHVDTGIDGMRIRGLRPTAQPDGHANNGECNDCSERGRCGASCACANRAETGRLDVAGGVQCWHEQTTARIADQISATMLREVNETFLHWFYGRFGVDVERLAVLLREGTLPIPAQSAPNTRIHPLAPRTPSEAEHHQTQEKRHLPVIF